MLYRVVIYRYHRYWHPNWPFIICTNHVESFSTVAVTASMWKETIDRLLCLLPTQPLSPGLERCTDPSVISVNTDLWESHLSVDALYTLQSLTDYQRWTHVSKTVIRLLSVTGSTVSCSTIMLHYHRTMQLLFHEAVLVSPALPYSRERIQWGFPVWERNN